MCLRPPAQTELWLNSNRHPLVRGGPVKPYRKLGATRPFAIGLQAIEAGFLTG